MAHDHFRQTDHTHLQYPSSNDHVYPPPPAAYEYDAQYRSSTRPRSRASSSATSEHQPQAVHQQPLKNAIGNAFEKSPAASVVDPELIAQITAEVKKSVLDEIKMSVGAGATQPQPVHPYVPPSPASTSASGPPRDVYTPPSPKNMEMPFHPPPPQVQDPFIDANDDTPTPRCERPAPVHVARDQSLHRPAPTTRMASDDYSPIERMWQRLFDAEGQPLPRLGQFLRGLALHLVCSTICSFRIITDLLQVEDYEPKNSLVISPSKMLKFYTAVSIHDEIYPWTSKSVEMRSDELLLTIYSNLWKTALFSLDQGVP